jgi:hypothetical protein
MCFSEENSLLVGTTGLLSSAYFYNKNIYASLGIGYFALMEVLQFLQYKVIDQCDNIYNKWLTTIGYLHICFQPLFVNIWLFAFTRHHNFTFLYLSFFAGLLLASRLLFVKDSELCDGANEPLCGKKTCSYTGTKHIAWNVRLRAPGSHWFTPSIGLHFFMWVIPALILFEIKPILAILLTGPYFGYFFTNNIHEQPAIWCFTSIAQMIITFLLIGGSDGRINI